MNNTTIINLPFAGLYDSVFSYELDTVEEREAENMAENDQEENKDVCLDASDYSGLLYDVANYGLAHKYVAEQYVSYLADVANETLGFDLGIKFEYMTSPKEYNFGTDQVFAHIPFESIKRMLASVNKEALAECINEHHSSRSGFISFYSNDVTEWLEKPVTEWDHNELGTLFIACMNDNVSFESDVFERMSDHNEFDRAFEEAIDWPEFESKVEALRIEKAAAC